jgi:hypothetical protein
MIRLGVHVSSEMRWCLEEKVRIKKWATTQNLPFCDSQVLTATGGELVGEDDLYILLGTKVASNS